MRLSSPAFTDGAPLSSRYTRDGVDHSPPLEWEDAPGETQSFALFAVDLDDPDGRFTHWVLYDVDPGRASLPEDTLEGRVGRNGFDRFGWTGPWPSAENGEHRLRFRLCALDVAHLGLEEGAHRDEVERRMQGHVIAETSITARYSGEARPGG